MTDTLEPATKRNNAAEAFVDTLHANGVKVIFGLPGSTEAPLLEALRADSRVRYTLTLHESVAVAMADGYARASGKVGVVGLHTSVGTMNGLSQLYGSWRDGTPVVVTAGHKDTGVLADDGFCAGDLPALARASTKLATQSLTADAVASDLRRAINVALAPPMGPTYLSIPEDFQAATIASRPIEPAFSGSAKARLERRPEAAAVASAIKRLLDCKHPVLILGSDVAEHVAAARALADALELPVFAVDRTQLRTLPYPVDEPRYLGQYGDDGGLVADADCVLAIGARLFYPFSSASRPTLPTNATIIHAHPEAHLIGWDASPSIGLAGDVAPLLADLLAAVNASGGLAPAARAHRATTLAAARARYVAALADDRTKADAAAVATGRISLAHVSAALGAVLPEGALVFDEAVSSSRILLRQCPFPASGRVHRSIGGALGWGLPAAVGAKIADRSRAVVALLGDGSFHFSPQALWTAGQEDAPVVTLVLDNSGYLAVKRAIERHVKLAEDPREHPGTNLPGIDHVAVARGYGAHAERIERAEDLGPALAAAMRSDRSTVLVVPVPNAR